MNENLAVAVRPRRVVVGVDGSLGSMQALRRGVAEARLRHADLWSVLAWVPPGGEIGYRRAPCPALLKAWREEYARRLAATWDEAMGGAPDDLIVRDVVIRGEPGRVLVGLAGQADDLLVVGAGSRNPLRRLFTGSTVRYCVAHARCCTVTVPPSPLAGEFRGGVLPRKRTQRGLARILLDGGPASGGQRRSD